MTDRYTRAICRRPGSDLGAGLTTAGLGAPDITLAERQFDLIWLPDIQPDEANRFSVVAGAVYHQTFTDLLHNANRDDFFARYPYAVAPTSDDQPFFFHFFNFV